MLVGVYGILEGSSPATDYVHYGEEAARVAAECDEPVLRAAVWTLQTFANIVAGDGRAYRSSPIMSWVRAARRTFWARKYPATACAPTDWRARSIQPRAGECSPDL